MRIKKGKPKLAQSVVEPKRPASEIQAIKVAEETGRPLTDTEVAALAAGVLQPNQLAGISVPAEDTAMSEESEDEDESKQSDEEPAEGENDSDDSESESESESDSDSDSDNDKDNGKNKENVDGGVDPVKLEPQEAPVEAPSNGGAVPMDQDTTGKEEDAQKLSSTKGEVDGMAVDEVADGGGGKDDAETAAGGVAATEAVGEGAGAASSGAGKADGGAGASAILAEEGTEGASDDDSSACSSDSSDSVMPLSVRTKKRKKIPMFPSSGPMAMPPMGDISDGEEEEGLDAGIPMTKNEAEEPILPLGEVTTDGAEVVEVGTILSLVDSDGTIVVQGKPQMMPLDEGSVLSSLPKGSKDPAATEPMGRVHEIFGPVDVPHYTVRVEGAATRHMLLMKYQTAASKLLKMEKARAKAAMAAALPEEDDKKSNENSVPSAEDKKKSEGDSSAGKSGDIAQPFDSSAWEFSSDEEEAQPCKGGKGKAGAKPTPTNAELRELQRVTCMTFGGQKVLDLQKAVKDAEKAMGNRKEHPFSRWQVGAKVYALKNHAKYLTADKLVKTSGTDASNCHDEEADEEEFSDDEKERLAKIRERKDRKRNRMLLQGVTPEEIEAIEREDAEQKRIVRERRHAEQAAAGRGGRGGGRGARRGRTDGRGGRGGGRGNRRGENRDSEGGGTHGESAWGKDSGGGGSDRGTTHWRHDQGSGGVGGMHPPSQPHNQPYYPQQYQGVPVVHMGAPGPANGFVPAAMPPGPPGGINCPLPPVAMQGPGGFQPAFGSPPIIPPPQQQSPPQFVNGHGMIPNPSQFVQQQQQQQPLPQFPPHPGGGPQPFVNHAGAFPPHGPNGTYRQ